MPYRDPDNQDEGDVLTGTRVCKVCNRRQPMERYHFAGNVKYRRRTCKKCCEDRRQLWRQNHPDKASKRDRDRARKLKYGIMPDDFDLLLLDQEYRCKICDTRLAGGTTHVDHDHKTGRIRGLLCFNCNVAIGHLRDDPSLLDRAAAYLRFSQAQDEYDSWWVGIEAEMASYGLGDAY